ncbi:MAG: hypothetical protein AAF581_12885 [Planctomycetota bacterium]
MVYPMRFTWRCCFYLLIVLGVGASAVCGLAILGIQLAPEGKEMTTIEAAIGLAFGVLLQPFAWSGLQHARLQLTETELRYLGFGFLCKTRSISLAEIERYGSGTVKGSGGGHERMLVLEMRDGYYKLIKLAMYERWGEMLKQLEEQLGKPPEETKRTLTGLRFKDE